MIQELIKKYALVPHPEGGYYKEIYRSLSKVMPDGRSEKRCGLTHIYFLLLKNQISRFHVVRSDEIWNFYEGAPIKLIQFDGQNIREKIFGDRASGYAEIVRGGVYQAAESTGEYSLVGCSVAPGFEFEDFSFLSDEQEKVACITKQYPDYSRFI